MILTSASVNKAFCILIELVTRRAIIATVCSLFAILINTELIARNIFVKIK